VTQSFLSQVTTGATQDGQRIVIAAVEGAGKTTLISQAPGSLLVPMEKGYNAITTPKIPLITKYSDLLAFMDEFKVSVQKGRNQFKSLSFDSATAMELLIHGDVLLADTDGLKKLGHKNHNMETAWGSYGKAYAVANNYFSDFLIRCDELSRYGKINIIIACHVFSSIVKDAAYGEYSTWDLLLHSPKNDKNYGKREMITQWADLVGFLHKPLFVTKADGSKMTQGVDAGQGRQLAVDRTPGWVAKNRFHLPSDLIPIPENNGWNYLAHAIYTNSGIDVYNRELK
jgi:hypothetical protein